MVHPSGCEGKPNPRRHAGTNSAASMYSFVAFFISPNWSQRKVSRLMEPIVKQRQAMLEENKSGTEPVSHQLTCAVCDCTSDSRPDRFSLEHDANCGRRGDLLHGPYAKDPARKLCCCFLNIHGICLFFDATVLLRLNSRIGGLPRLESYCVSTRLARTTSRRSSSNHRSRRLDIGGFIPYGKA